MFHYMHNNWKPYGQYFKMYGHVDIINTHNIQVSETQIWVIMTYAITNATNSEGNPQVTSWHN